MKLNLCGQFQDANGYGEFARFFAYALCQGGTEISCENIMLTSSISKSLDFGIKGSVVKSKSVLMSQSSDANIVFMIPPLFKAYRRKQAKLNIGFTMFEADSLPPGWADACNEMDAIFVPSEWNKKGFENSGVTKPIYVVPAGIVRDEANIERSIVKNDIFTFYSIFQWTERKNPINLLKAYYVAMKDQPKVRLVLKTYIDSRIEQNRDKILVEIDKLKKELKLTSYPEVLLITDFISNQEMKKLHLSSHCFLAPARAEGWNIPAIESMALGNAVIATNYSGNTQYMTSDNTIPISYFLTPCISSGNFAPFFNGTMRWAEPNIEQLIAAIQDAYNNQAKCGELGAHARQHILSNFNENTASKIMRAAIQDLSR